MSARLGTPLIPSVAALALVPQLILAQTPPRRSEAPTGMSSVPVEHYGPPTEASQGVVPAGTIPAITPPRPGSVIFRQQVWTQGYPFLVTARGLDVRRQGHHGH